MVHIQSDDIFGIPNLAHADQQSERIRAAAEGHGDSSLLVNEGSDHFGGVLSIVFIHHLRYPKSLQKLDKRLGRLLYPHLQKGVVARSKDVFHDGFSPFRSANTDIYANEILTAMRINDRLKPPLSRRRSFSPDPNHPRRQIELVADDDQLFSVRKYLSTEPLRFI